MWRFVIFLAVAAATFVYLYSDRNRTKSDAIGSWRKITAAKIPGCTEIKSLDKLNEYLDQDDRAAYEKRLKDAIASGECIQFLSGQEVYVLDSHASKLKLRLRGDTSEYWASRQALADPKPKSQ